MNRTCVSFLTFLILAGLCGGTAVLAYEEYSADGSIGNCADCHDGFTEGTYFPPSGSTSWPDGLHNTHRNTMLGGDCNTCHSSGGRSPVFLGSSAGGDGLQSISCVGCHGRDGDIGNDSESVGRGAGLRQHHFNAF